MGESIQQQFNRILALFLEEQAANKNTALFLEEQAANKSQQEELNAKLETLTENVASIK